MSAPDNTTVRDIAAAEALAMAGDGALLRRPGPGRARHRRSDCRRVPVGKPLLQGCPPAHGAGRDVSNMAGGMKAWHQADLPMVTDDGRPGSV